MSNFQKSWKTTVLGVLIILYHAYNFISNGVEIDFHTVIEMLLGLGLIATKDFDVTHSKKRTGDDYPNPDEQIEP
jgi:hypothetical protein